MVWCSLVLELVMPASVLVWYVQNKGLRCSSSTPESSMLAVSLNWVSSWLSPPLRVCGVGEEGRERVGGLPTFALTWSACPWSHNDTALLCPTAVLRPANRSSDILFGRSTACWSSSLLLERMQQKFRGITSVQKIMPRLTPKVTKVTWISFQTFSHFPFVQYFVWFELADISCVFAWWSWCCFSFLLLLPWSFSSRGTIHSPKLLVFPVFLQCFLSFLNFQ